MFAEEPVHAKPLSNDCHPHLCNWLDDGPTGTARFTTRVSVAVVSKRRKNADYALVFSRSKILVIRGDIANSGRHLKCGNC